MLSRHLTTRMILVLLALTAGGITGCGGYQSRIVTVRGLYERGDYRSAIHEMETIHPAKRDELLYWLDKGMIEHAAGEYADSIASFEKAIDLSEYYSRRNILAQTGAVVSNDTMLPYIGDPFDILYAHLYQAINYAAIHEWNEALVEVRRINTRFDDMCQEPPTSLCHPFLLYMSAMIWSENHLDSDAAIDWRRLERLFNDVPLARRSREKDRTKGRVAIVVESNRVPIKVSSEYDHPLQVIPIPLYADRDREVHAVSVWIGDRHVGDATPLADIGRLARAALRDQMPAIIARAIARISVKTGAAIAVGEEVDKDLGTFLAIALMATNKADLRSWSTLPLSMMAWNGPLKPGQYPISLHIDDGRVISLGEVTVSAGKTTLLTYRLF